MTALIVGCVLGMCAFAVAYPPGAWILGALVATAVAFAGNTRD